MELTVPEIIQRQIGSKQRRCRDRVVLTQILQRWRLPSPHRRLCLPSNPEGLKRLGLDRMLAPLRTPGIPQKWEGCQTQEQLRSRLSKTEARKRKRWGGGEQKKTKRHVNNDGTDRIEKKREKWVSGSGESDGGAQTQPIPAGLGSTVGFPEAMAGK